MAPGGHQAAERRTRICWLRRADSRRRTGDRDGLVIDTYLNEMIAAVALPVVRDRLRQSVPSVVFILAG